MAVDNRPVSATKSKSQRYPCYHPEKILDDTVFGKSSELGYQCKKNSNDDTVIAGRAKQNQYRQGCRVCKQTSGTDPPVEYDDNIVTKTGQIRMMGE